MDGSPAQPGGQRGHQVVVGISEKGAELAASMLPDGIKASLRGTMVLRPTRRWWGGGQAEHATGGGDP